MLKSHPLCFKVVIIIGERAYFIAGHLHYNWHSLSLNSLNPFMGLEFWMMNKLKILPLFTFPTSPMKTNQKVPCVVPRFRVAFFLLFTDYLDIPRLSVKDLPLSLRQQPTNPILRNSTFYRNITTYPEFWELTSVFSVEFWHQDWLGDSGEAVCLCLCKPSVPSSNTPEVVGLMMLNYKTCRPFLAWGTSSCLLESACFSFRINPVK